MMSRRTFARSIAGLGIAGLIGPASARTVTPFTSRRGIIGQSVTERSAPLVALRFGIRAGATEDPPGREGLTSFLLAMLQEGAGDLDERRYKDALRAAATQISFSSARDRISGGIVSRTQDLMRGVELLRLALVAPRFDAGPLDRVRQQFLGRLDIADNDARQVAQEAWFSTAFAGHPYGRSTRGTRASIAAITRDDLAAHHAYLFGRDRLFVTTVGDIDETGASALADSVFAELPAASGAGDVAPASPRATPRPVVVDRVQPQSVTAFGMPGLPGTSPGYPALLVLNQILGSGEFDARLVEEIRVKRGLTYAIRTSVVTDRTISIVLGQFASRNEVVGEALGIIDSELRRMARSGPTPDEVDTAKSYLSGSLLLNFDGNAALADAIVGSWLDGWTWERFLARHASIDIVSMSDVASVASQLLDPKRLAVAIVGRPKL